MIEKQDIIAQKKINFKKNFCKMTNGQKFQFQKGTKTNGCKK